MTDEHKAALAKGRAEGRIVRDYLEGLRATKPKRGRKRTPETIIEASRSHRSQNCSAASPIDELLLIQERKNLEAERSAMSNSIDMEALEHEFVGRRQELLRRQSDLVFVVARRRRPRRVLKAAGISRSD